MTDDNDMPPEESDSDDDATLEGSTEGLIQPTVPVQDVGVESADADTVQPANPGIAVGEAVMPQVVATIPQVQMEQSTTEHESWRAETLTGFGQEADWLRSDQPQFFPNFIDTAGQERLTVDGVSTVAQDPEDDNLESYTFPNNSIVPTLGIVDQHISNDLPSAERRLSEADVTTSREDRPPAVLRTPPTTAPPLPATQVPPEAAETFVNLDAEDHEEWQNGEYDFGDEPLDEPWDTWGCLHHFTPLHKNKMHEYWLPSGKHDGALQSVKQVDCLKCYKTIEISEPDLEGEKVDAARKDSGVEIPSPHRQSIGERPGSLDTTDASSEPGQLWKKKRNNRKDGPKLFNCTQCGVVYCTKCKKATVKELRASLEGNKSAD